MTYPPPPPGAPQPGGSGPASGYGGPAYGSPAGGYGSPTGYGPPPGYGPLPGPPAYEPRKGPSVPAILGVGVAIAAMVLVAAFVVVRVRDDEPAAASLTRSQLRAALLTVDDLEGSEVDTDEPDETSPGDISGPPACSDLIGRLQDDRDLGLFGLRGADAEVTLSVPGEAFVSHFITDDGAELLSDFRSIIDECADLTYDDGFFDGDITVSEADTFQIGDESILLEYERDGEVDGADVSHTIDLLVWTRDGIVSELGLVSNDPDTGELVDSDLDLLEELAREADARLAQEIAEAG